MAPSEHGKAGSEQPSSEQPGQPGPPGPPGSTLRALRERLGMSQQELAQRAGLTQAAVSELEAGRRDGLLRTWRLLAQALGVSLEHMLQRL